MENYYHIIIKFDVLLIEKDIIYYNTVYVTNIEQTELILQQASHIQISGGRELKFSTRQYVRTSTDKLT